MTQVVHARRWPSALRAWRAQLGGGQPLYPILVLFALNAVDELDRTAFGVLLPNIRDHFGLDTSGILTVVALSSLAALIIGIPVGYYADRVPRVAIALTGAIVWCVFSVFTGLATTVVLLGVARAGSGIGKAVNDPVHGSLIADYYDIPDRPAMYSLHRAANAVGQIAGPLLAGLLAYQFGWRAPFFVFAVPTAIFVVLALRLKEPSRGHWERRAAGAGTDVQLTDDVPPSFAESWRICWSVRTLRRIFYSLPFLAMSVVGLATLSGLLYEEAFGLDERARGFVAAAAEPAAIVGLVLGVPLATRLFARDPGLVLKFLGVIGLLVAGAFIGFALVPNLGLAIAMNIVLSGLGAVLAPGIAASLSLAIPPKIRSFGFAVSLLFVLPGLVVLPLIGWVADNHGIRTGMIMMTPVFLVGAALIASAGQFVRTDITQVWATAAAQSEVLLARRNGQAKLLLVRGVDVAYDRVQVLFGVDIELAEGEIVALLGTNGAGKSTLLRAICGLTEASAGAVVFDGRDMTHTPPDEVAARGVVMMPGGKGVFTSLSVRENLQLAGWVQRHDHAWGDAATRRVLHNFPVLEERIDESAGNLSGGQQQMLALSMAFIQRPRLLMVDELALGLSPAVVAQLLEMLSALRDEGTTVILVEQSVEIALAVADTAYFMEKGEIRFHGPTAELLERPDILRSIFLGGAASRHGPITAQDRRERPEPSTEQVMSVRGIGKRFGGNQVLNDVSFELGQGEIVGVLGPNGAGKTTLFDVLCGFVVADSGVILLRRGGEVYDITGFPAHARAATGMGRTFQDARLFPALTVAEVIALALETHLSVRSPVAAALHLPWAIESESRIQARVDELVELLGLGTLRHKFVRELSTGSRRIVELACALAHGASVLLMDEPSSGIAQRETEALGPLLLRVRDELGASLLVIEHDIPLLRSIADRLVALDLGRVIATGDPDDVVQHPRVVASYLGTSTGAPAQPTPVPAPSP